MLLSTYYKTYNSRQVKLFISLILLIPILVLTLKVQLDMLPASLYSTNYKILTTQYSINFFSNITDEELFKVSPFDDYIYYNDKKDHIYNRYEYRAKKDYLSAMFNFLSPIKTLTWSVSGKRGDISYFIKADESEVNIQRMLSSIDIPYSIGQSIIFCSDCLIADDYGRIYFNPNQITNENIKLAESFKMTPFLLDSSQFFPKGINKIKVIGKNGKTKFQIYINQHQYIFYDEKYHVLELKTFINKNEPIFVSQRITFSQ